MELLRIRVLHPKYGALETLAYCRLDAIMQASGAWRMSPEEEKECKIAVSAETMERLRKARDPAG